MDGHGNMTDTALNPLLQRALEASPVGMLICDMQAADHPLIYVNPAFERITGYAGREVLGRNCRFLQEADSDQPGLASIRAALKEGREGRALLRNYRRDGSPFWNELAITPVRDDAGCLTHYVGVMQDITARRHAELELARALEVARAASRAESAFLSRVGHELRTPLNTILGFAQLLEMDPEMGTNQADDVREIIHAGQHLLDLINQRLELAPMASGSRDP